MAASFPNRSFWVSYMAGLAVIAGLMGVVAFGGSAVTAKKDIAKPVPPTVSAMRMK